jgi:hypothetical protein
MFTQSEFKLFQVSEITEDSLDTAIKTKKDGIFLQMLVNGNYFSYDTVPREKATPITTTTTTPTTTTTTTTTTITTTITKIASSSPLTN